MLVEQSVACPVLIGRAAPLSAAVSALDRARTARGNTVLISGEAGIGKSRFVRDMVDRARALGFVTMQGSCFEADRAQPYAPLLDLLRAFAASTSPLPGASGFAAVASEFVTLFPELRSIFPEAAARAPLEPEEDRRRFFHAFLTALHALGATQPVLLVIEDVHWSDDATLDLVLHLARKIAGQPISLVLTFRSDEIGARLSRLLADLDRARCGSEIALRPLCAADVTEFVRSIFGAHASLGAPFINALYEITEGNPFFIEEMLKALLVAGDLVYEDEAWRARALDRVHVPRTATEAVGRRLSNLSTEARRVASIAAVAGRRFDFALLQSLTHHPELELLVLVKELLDAQLVVEEGADRFAFRHALTREAIRARLLVRERVALHRSIAAALEASHADGSSDDFDALAHHLFEAGSWELAHRYALLAAARAVALSAPREALQHYERAASTALRAGIPLSAELLIGKGRAHETLGAFPQANDDFTAALAAARIANDAKTEWMALHALGMLWSARDYERAGAYRHDALAVARTLGDRTSIAHSLNRVGNWFVNREDPHSGISYHDEALDIFERLGDQRGVAETVDLLAMAHYIANSPKVAAELFTRSIELFTALGNRRALANALAMLPVCGPSHHLSSCRTVTGAHDAELLASQRAITLAVEISWRAGECFARYLLADCLAWRGEYARSIQLAHESLSIAEEIGHREWQCAARCVLGVIALDLFDSAGALAQLTLAHEIAQRLGSATWMRWTAAPLAIALARAGRAADAGAVLDAVERTIHPGLSGNTETIGTRYVALARAEIALEMKKFDEVLTILDADGAIGAPAVGLLRARAMVARGDLVSAEHALANTRDDARAQHARLLLWRIEGVQGDLHLGSRRRLEARRCYDAARAIAAETSAQIEDLAVRAQFQHGIDGAAPPPPASTAKQREKAAHGGLTRREHDAAALIAEGKSNRAIARALGIGERTVEGYVASTLAKLGFSSRTQIAVWASDLREGASEISVTVRR